MKKHLKRLFPTYHRVRDHESLKLFGALLHDPNLWHMNRHSVAGAFAVGLFCAFLPIPAQMVAAAAIAIPLRINLPISVLLVWITNPLTWAPIYFFAYRLGARILDVRHGPLHFEPTIEWLAGEAQILWKPLLLGSLLMSALSAIVGYFAIHLLWRLHLIRRLRQRRKIRREGRAQ